MKSLDQKNLDLTIAKERIRQLEAKVKSLRPKKRKKVILDPNLKFVTIEQVMALRAQIDEELEEEGTLEEDEEVEK